MVREPLTAGEIVPATRFTDGDGKAIATESLLSGGGSLPTVLAFFKTSCPTCRLAWPYLELLHKRYGKAGARVVGVSQDDGVSTGRFYNEYGNATFGRLFDAGPAFAASTAFGVESVPFVLLVRPSGKVEQAFSGWQRQALEDMGKRIAEISSLPYRRLLDVNDPVPPWRAG